MTARYPLVQVTGLLKELPSGDTLQLNASAAGGASLNVPQGTAPTSPVNGDFWTTTSGAYIRINGSTVGPLGVGGTPDLTGSTGLVSQTAASTYAARTLTAGAGVSITDPDGVSGNPTISVTGGAGGVGMIFVGSATVAGSAATTLTLSGLDLNADGRYFVILTLKNATTSAASISMYYNSDTTATNYDRVTLSGAGVTPTSTRGNDALVTSMDSNTAATGAGDTICQIWVSNDLDARPLANSINSHSGNAIMIIQNVGHRWRTASTNVTGITISSAVASALAVGSKIEVWKMSV